MGPLIKEEILTGTELDTKEEKIQQDFLWELRPKATPNNTVQIPNRTGQN